MAGWYEIDWDMIDPHGTMRFAHFEGLYYVLESVTRRNPDLMLELNNGGGNNIDLGTLGRHTLIGPGFATLDVAASRSVDLGEGQRLDFRLEVFNLLNSPNVLIGEI